MTPGIVRLFRWFYPCLYPVNITLATATIIRTDKTVSKVGIRFKVLAVMYHCLAQISNRQNLLLVFDFVALREGLDVDGHGLV
jgi:hypothetical protein